MNQKYSPALVCGFGAAVLMTLPGLKSFSCCLIVPFAAGLSLYFEQRLHGVSVISMSKGAFWGLMTGLFAGMFGSVLETLMTFLLRSNDFVMALPEMEKALRELKIPVSIDESIKLFRQMANEIRVTGFSFTYTAVMFFSNLFTDALFGLIGGLIGSSYLNKRNVEKNGNNQ